MSLPFRWATLYVLFVLPLSLLACAGESPQPRTPLALQPMAAPEAQSHTEQGLRDYQNGQYVEAKAHFQTALASAPQSAEAHYNLGLALFAMGDIDQAREHFIEAANLAPGHKVIWDSPALRPYGSPEPTIKQTKEPVPPGRGGGFGGIGR
jgi:Tfp pilus assembly protein PilF